MRAAAVRQRGGAGVRAALPGGTRETRWVGLLKSYGPLVGLLLAVGVLGQLGVFVARPLFIVGSFVTAALAYRRGGLGLHVEVCITLFVLGPFLRRVIDLHVGYDSGATTLVGPLLALMAAFPELRALLSDRVRGGAVFLPFLTVAACVSYGWTLSAFENNVLQASIAAAKYTVPMLYSMCLVLRPDQSDNVLRSAARTFLILCPPIGLYGILQYLSPPAWDIFWMISSKVPSNGEPEARKLRVFSTMNSPTSFAFYASCGLLLFSFTRSVLPPLLVPVVALLPLSMALLLSGIRTSWISVAISLLFCLLFNRTRGRAGALIVCLALGVAVTLLYTSFGSAISDRMNTLGGGVAQDGSGSERLHDYMYVFSEGKRYLFGTGLASTDGDPNMKAFDGQLLLSVVQMGLVIGTLHTLAILWAGGQALLGLRRNGSVLRLVAGSVIVAHMSVFLLLAFSLGEIGFLFWMLVGVLTPGVERLPPRRPGRLGAAPSPPVPRAGGRGG